LQVGTQYCRYAIKDAIKKREMGANGWLGGQPGSVGSSVLRQAAENAAL